MKKNQTTRLSTLYLIALLTGFFLFTILISGVLVVKLRDVIANSEEAAVSSSLLTIKNHLSSYLEERATQLEDHATFPILVQTVMQPERDTTVLKDFMGELRILGNSYQLVLTDFLGQPIHSTQLLPVFSFSGQPWIDDMMEGNISRHVTYRHDGHQYFWEIAVPVLYHDLPEGILITEIPIGPTHQLQGLTKELHDAQLQLRLHDQVVGTWGMLEEESVPHFEQDAVFGLDLYYRVSPHNIARATQAVLWPILFLCGGITIVFGLVGILIGRRYLIHPIEQLQVDSSSSLDETDFQVLPTDQAIQEIQDLAHHFNIVQQRAWSRKEDILAINASLESRIDEATKALSEQNHDLIVARDEALIAVRSKAMFLATMSHEIRTPMNGILGMAELLADTDMSTDQHDLIHTLRSSGENLLTIINDILDFSKIESGKLTIEQIDFDLRASVEEVLNILTPQAQGKGLELVGLVHANTPTALRGDPVRFRQILTNFVGNAIKFTATGEVFIQVTPFALSHSHAHIRVEVKDTGIGLDLEEQRHLFQAFTQANQGTTRKYGGSGLGLAICRQLVELMHGEIGVDSTPGTGSCFWFTLKFPRQAPSLLPSLSEVPLNDLRILFVDDNATNRFILDHYAESWGMHSSSASSGAQALILLEAAAEEGQPFDLLVIDEQMPGMDGFELAQRIKSTARWQNIPLVLLTSLGYKGEAIQAKQANFSGYLTKPIHQPTLRRSVALVMGLEDVSPKAEGHTFITRHTVQEQEMAEKARILLAEDNMVNQKVAVRMLTKLGYQVDVANNGREAFDAWEKKPYHGILMDCLMPDMDGFQVTLAIRKIESERLEVRRKEHESEISTTTDPLHLMPHWTDHIPIIAMTANTMEGDREKCLEAGMDDFIPKPVNMEFLGTVLAKWLSGQDESEQRIEEVVSSVPSNT